MIGVYRNYLIQLRILCGVGAACYGFRLSGQLGIPQLRAGLGGITRLRRHCRSRYLFPGLAGLYIVGHLYLVLATSIGPKGSVFTGLKDDAHESLRGFLAVVPVIRILRVEGLVRVLRGHFDDLPAVRKGCRQLLICGELSILRESIPFAEDVVSRGLQVIRHRLEICRGDLHILLYVVAAGLGAVFPASLAGVECHRHISVRHGTGMIRVYRNYLIQMQHLKRNTHCRVFTIGAVTNQDYFFSCHCSERILGQINTKISGLQLVKRNDGTAINDICKGICGIVISLQLHKRIACLLGGDRDLNDLIPWILIDELWRGSFDGILYPTIKDSAACLRCCGLIVCRIDRIGAVIQQLTAIRYTIAIRVYQIHVRANLIFNEIPQAILITVVHWNISIRIAVCQMLIGCAMIQRARIDKAVSILFIWIIRFQPGIKQQLIIMLRNVLVQKNGKITNRNIFSQGVLDGKIRVLTSRYGENRLFQSVTGRVQRITGVTLCNADRTDTARIDQSIGVNINGDWRICSELRSWLVAPAILIRSPKPNICRINIRQQLLGYLFLDVNHPIQVRGTHFYIWLETVDRLDYHLSCELVIIQTDPVAHGAG